MRNMMVKQRRINKKGSENQLPFLLREGETYMYITADTIITAAGVFGALLTISTLIYKVVQWLQEQKKQSKAIAEINDEMCLLTYAVLACLKGIQEQGCNGPVSDAVEKVEKHLNQKAHKDYSG